LLERQLNVAADGAATNFFGAAVCRFHDARTAAGHDSEPEPRNGRAHFSGKLVMRIVAVNSRRAENGYTGTNEVEDTKTAQEVAHHSQQG
jgi:hypothetical protein